MKTAEFMWIYNTVRKRQPNLLERRHAVCWSVISQIWCNGYHKYIKVYTYCNQTSNATLFKT